MSPRARKLIPLVLVLLPVALLVVLGYWWSLGDNPPLVATPLAPERVMGTSCELVAITPPHQVDSAEEALAEAEELLRDLEAQMSVYLERSRLSVFNAAPAGESFPLTDDLAAVLKDARQAWQDSDGAFDVTVYPLVELWTACAKAGAPPTDEQLAAAVARVGMDKLQLDDGTATKLAEGVRVDLGGIAKGYAVDRATELLQKQRWPGGMVNLGGNIRLFGADQYRRPWEVAIQHPFATERVCGRLLLSDAAVSTSGNYYRFHLVAGRRYSHILDPRTGRPVQGAPSVTVVSLATAGTPPSACLADAWSTALSVLGPEGLKRLKAHPGLEAMMILGDSEKHQVRMTEGFKKLLVPGTSIDLD